MVYYAVHIGRQPGIYTNWNDCKKQIEKFDGAQFKKFDNRDDAQKFFENGFGKKTFQKNLSVKEKILKAVEVKNENKIHSVEDIQDENKLFIYTDGSLIRKGKEVAAGYSYYIPVLGTRVSKQLKNQKITNNRAELTAIIESIETLPNEHLTKKICIFTDSQYSIFIFEGTGERYEKNNFKNEKNEEVPNIDLIQKLLHLKRTYDIVLLKVRAHTTNTDTHSHGNSIADNLANDAALKGIRSKTNQREPNFFEENVYGTTTTNNYTNHIEIDYNEDRLPEFLRKPYNMDNDDQEETKSTLNELFDNYNENKNILRKNKTQNVQIENKKVDTSKLKNTNLKNWFFDNNDD